MTQESNALRLAECLDEPLYTTHKQMMEAAAELRRLLAENSALLEALKAMLTHMGMDEDTWNKPTFNQARAAVAKAEGENYERS